MRRLMRSALVYIVCAGALLYGCASRVQPPPEPPSPRELPARPPEPVATLAPVARDAAECTLIGEPGEPVITVALGNAVTPSNAPFPANASERTVFRQLFETLVRVDCEGRARAGLAAAWQMAADARTWIVTLREGARFSDGSPVTAEDVVNSWTSPGAGEGLRPQVRPYVESVSAIDDLSLAIVLRPETGGALLVLADATLAVVRRVPGSRWPLGTRGLEVAPDEIAAGGRSIITLADATENAANGVAPLRFVVAPGRDARDFLDERVDLLVTRDPATLEYAATLPEFLSLPLAWNEVHVFLSRWRTRAQPQLSLDARQTLARDAVRGEARGAEGPFWWEGLPDCDIRSATSGTTVTRESARVVYERGDRAAQDLAERFVALAAAPSSTSGEMLGALARGRPGDILQRAAPLAEAAFMSALARGADAGYVLAFDRSPLAPCQQLRSLADRARWVDPENIVPLVDTRPRAVVRQGRSGITVEWGGGLLFRPTAAAK